MSTPTKRPHLLRAHDIASSAETFSHPWNPRSEMRGMRLGQALGLARTGVNLVRLAPGKESFVEHTHRYEEEWIYVLSGRALATIDGEEVEVGAGDFLAFPTPSVSHHMKNAFDDELVYLVGGESRDFEVADFPTLGRRMVRTGAELTVYRLEDGRPFPDAK